ncbi:helix-turn-helix domain-containing protein [Fodinisporobacter ferrooxydans]|uniref:Helix-turn-helix domain-containing protein n=1 Tax=Fodinisporobacter ferrooxydans TaxID=2901836 RepID=A0ABY4CMS8_9BACL|nr:helix-turn-helix domain-containing protein [Alicyclobacillaceae bacterium MYW30-H2]
MANFSERMTELFETRNVTKRALSQAVDVSERMIQYYVTGKKSPTMETLIALADYFQVSLDYLVGRSDEPERR